MERLRRGDQRDFAVGEGGVFRACRNGAEKRVDAKGFFRCGAHIVVGLDRKDIHAACEQKFGQLARPRTYVCDLRSFWQPLDQIVDQSACI